MSIEVKMPALSPTMAKGSIAKWLVNIGDVIKSGDLIAEIETDKATMEIEASDDGTLVEILIQEGTDDVPVGTPIAIVSETDADRSARAVLAKPEIAPTLETSAVQTSIEIASVAAPALVPTAKISGDPAKITPLARRLAGALGIDLSTISGSGPYGKIVKADLGIAATTAHPVSADSAPAAGFSPTNFDLTAQKQIPHDEVKLSSMRKTIARRLTESKQQIPHIYLTVDVRLDALLALRSETNEMLQERGVKISVNDMVVKALALALMDVPACNVTFAGETLLRYRRADISVAVSIPNGLITPVIKGAEGKALSTIATETRELTARARDGKLQPADYQGGTASISNMGMMNIRQFDAVINPPQAMILAVGAADKRAVVIDGTIAVATMMTLTGSFDHRAIDGADAAELMNAVRRLIEHPMELLL